MSSFGFYPGLDHWLAWIGENPSQSSIDDAMAEQVASVWRAMFPDAAVLPVIGYPSHGKGVMTLTYSGNISGLPPSHPMTINGVTSGSPLANNALYSAELRRWN